MLLVTQAADGALTYVGVRAHGTSAELNPLATSLVEVVGLGGTITGIKLLASMIGVSLHLLGVYRIVAVLAGIYLLLAVVPWTILLLFR